MSSTRTVASVYDRRCAVMTMSTMTTMTIRRPDFVVFLLTMGHFVYLPCRDAYFHHCALPRLFVRLPKHAQQSFCVRARTVSPRQIARPTFCWNDFGLSAAANPLHLCGRFHLIKKKLIDKQGGKFAHSPTTPSLYIEKKGMIYFCYA